MGKQLHIVSFSVPFPANYGGVIDVFYKLKSLSNAGVDITLHCFQYDREPAKELEEFCETVFYYPRKMMGTHLLGFYPFIVGSRSSEELIKNLLMDNAPILFEGLHTCMPILDERLKSRKKLVRSHNIEHDYYSALAKLERNPMKRLYYKSEARKLERFEPLAYKNADVVLGISKKDTDYLTDKYKNAVHVSAFHGFESVNIPEKTEDFSLYHGNLSVGENNEAAIFLANEVFKGLEQKLIIAGNNPSVQLQKVVNKLHPLPLISPNPKSEFSNHDVYFPKIIRNDSLWLMYYTSKNEQNEEFLCVAKSDNLMDWKVVKENVLTRNQGWNAGMKNLLCAQVKIVNHQIHLWATGTKDVGNYKKPNKGNALDVCIGKFHTSLNPYSFTEDIGNPIFGGNPTFDFENDHIGGAFQEIDYENYTYTFYHGKGRSGKEYTILVK